MDYNKFFDSLDWQEAKKDTKIFPGMAIELNNGERAIVGTQSGWMASNKGTGLRDGGCGCCSESSTPGGDADFDVKKWAWAIEQGKS